MSLGDPDASDLHQAFKGPLLLASGQLVVGDAGGERTETITVEPGAYVAQVLADDRAYPSRLVVALRRA